MPANDSKIVKEAMQHLLRKQQLQSNKTTALY